MDAPWSRRVGADSLTRVGNWAGEPADDLAVAALARAIVRSYQDLLGRPLVEHSVTGDEGSASIPEALYASDAAILCHTTDADPLFNYVNATAQRLWSRPWHEFVGLPSRLSARPDAREVREVMLREVGERGWTTGYSGVRVSATGELFRILDAELWQVRDDGGHLIGVAARIPAWEPVDDPLMTSDPSDATSAGLGAIPPEVSAEMEER